MRDSETDKQKSKPSRMGSVISKVKVLDDFGEAPSMKINEGDDKIYSYCGAFLTIILIGITSIFLYSKAMVLYKGTDVTIMGNLAEGAYTYDDTFTADNGLFIAAALTEYNYETEIIEEKRYGELIIQHYGWGNTADFGLENTVLDTHYCSDAELGLAPDPDNISSIYPIFESQKKEIELWKKKFKCIPREDLIVWGDYNSVKAQQIAINFEMCDNTKERFAGVACETKEAIQEWLRRKFIVVVFNQIRFDPKGFLDNATIPEARVNFIPISSQVRQIIPYKIDQTLL